MKLLHEIKDQEWPKNTSTLKIREASRAVLFDENGLIPLLFVSKCNYHKLPGGGIDNGESKMEALRREVLEETGCRIKITGEVGKIVEFRSKYNLKQASYCYIGKIISKGKPNFTKDELDEGFRIVWLPLNKAISTIENDKPADYQGHFIQERDKVFLNKIKQMVD